MHMWISWHATRRHFSVIATLRIQQMRFDSWGAACEPAQVPGHIMNAAPRSGCRGRMPAPASVPSLR